MIGKPTIAQAILKMKNPRQRETWSQANSRLEMVESIKEENWMNDIELFIIFLLLSRENVNIESVRTKINRVARMIGIKPPQPYEKETEQKTTDQSATS